MQKYLFLSEYARIQTYFKMFLAISIGQTNLKDYLCSALTNTSLQYKTSCVMVN